MKPYRYSRKAKRYIPTSQKSNRFFYYKRLSQITGCNFDPHSTFGKFVMRKLISQLRMHRRYEKNISKFEIEIEHKKSKFSNELDKYESAVFKDYDKIIKDISLKCAYSENNYLKILRYFPIIISMSVFIVLIFYIGGIAFIPSIFIYSIIHKGISTYFNRVIKKYNDMAMDRYSGKLPNDQISEFKSILKKEISDLYRSLESAKNKLKNVEDSIKNKFNSIMREDRIEFILSDQFYTSTEWTCIRNEVLETRNNKCSECGAIKDLTVDHIKPRSKYPELALKKSNTQILCRSCNSSKGNKVS